ncbi:MAG: type II CRISPR RNA-guided endonuclease Cas9 [Gammaproteobacteria bacterium]|nr:type II CRISPR RNA-guided endonuclease Cas9 [Gammaproteobacteria bacterium]
MQTANKQRVLGLDLGTTSVGFALIDYDQSLHSGSIVHMGVRIFPDTRDNKTEVPLNQQRRAKRLVRRQVRRRRKRRRELNEFLNLHGLLPKYGTEEWHSLMRLDPYELRRRGLHEELSPFEFGRALYHLSKRRHFLGRAIETQDFDEPDGEDNKTREDRENVLRELKEHEMTLGEWLATRTAPDKKRNVKASRDVVRQEFQRLIDHQEQFHKETIQDYSSLKSHLEQIIFEQKPVFWRLNTLGQCRFFPESELCHSGSWLAHQRRMLEMFNNLLVVGNLQPLDDEQREAILEHLGSRSHMTWTQVRKALAPIYETRSDEGYEKTIKFNLEEGGARHLLGNPVEKDLKEIFGDDWDSFPLKQEVRDQIHTDLWNCDYKKIKNQRVVINSQEIRQSKRQALAIELQERYGITTAKAEALTKLSLKTGWEPYSVEATKIFVEMLEKGYGMGSLLNSPDWAEWRNSNFPHENEGSTEQFDRLPSPKHPSEQARLRAIRNPTVVRAQNELRKVVNNLIDTYGKPDRIRIELARGLKLPKAVRSKIQKRNKENESLREAARKNLEENHIVNPSRRDVDKWVLWKECHEECPYTGSHIGFESLFGANPSFDIEHIWPRSRSFDDSLANKTLCLSSENQIKGNKTPYEYLGSNRDRWFHVEKRLEKMRAKGNNIGMSVQKIRRFRSPEIPDDFANRQLTDTSYVSTEAVASLKRLWTNEENARNVLVQAVSGRGTSILRKLWGMNNILSGTDAKTRDDHRHHAVDALVVACMHPSIHKQLSEYWSRKESHYSRPLALDPPWPTLRQDAAIHLESIVVSHRVRRRVSGALHEETVYRRTGNVSGKGNVEEFDIRKPIVNLTSTEKKNVRDAKLREVVLKSDKTSEIRLGHGPEVKRARVIKNKDPKLLRNVSNGYVESGENHHMAVYRDEHGRTKYEVVTRFDAAKRLSQREPVVQRTRPNSEFINSFSIGEAIQIDAGEYIGVWIVKMLRADGRVYLIKHDDARPKPSAIGLAINQLITKHKIRKISVDPIGRVRPSND